MAKELSLHITDRCTFNCAFCVWGDSLLSRGERIAASDLEAFLVANRGCGFERVNLHGGEPTLRSDLWNLLRLIRSLGYASVSIQSNGWALASRAFVARLADAGVSVFVISLHGHTPGLQDAMSGVSGSFARVLRAIENVRTLGRDAHTNTVLTRANYVHLPEILRVAAEAGATRLNVSALMPSGRALTAVRALMPSYDEVRPYVLAAADTANSRGARMTLEGFPQCVVAGLEERCIFRDAAHGGEVRCFVRGTIWASHDTVVAQRCKTRVPACSGCARYDECPGIYTVYVRQQGASEFRPFPAARQAVERNASDASR